MEVIKAALGDVKEILEGVVASAAASAKIVGMLGALRAVLGAL